MGALESKALLWCLLCSDRFSSDDVDEGRYFAQTGICTKCYTRMKKSDDTCFGKENGDGRYGFDESTEECGEFCPDREVCRLFVQNGKRTGTGSGLPERKKNLHGIQQVR